MQWLTGFALGLLVAAIAYALGALTRAGAFAAALLGGVTFGAAGLPAAILLLAFFLSSNLLSRIGTARKRALVREVGKGARRDQIQVLANGLVAGVCALGFGFSGSETWLLGLAGALAAVNADTWSTELGVLSEEAPRLILGGARVPIGTSGGVTRQGTLAALGGAFLIGLVAVFAFGEWPFLPIITLSGFSGAMLDSLLGASFQAQYFCSQCEKITEKHPEHSCGSRTSLIRGWRFLSNDAVNFLASILGAVISGVLWLFLEGVSTPNLV